MTLNAELYFFADAPAHVRPRLTGFPELGPKDAAASFGRREAQE